MHLKEAILRKVAESPYATNAGHMDPVLVRRYTADRQLITKPNMDPRAKAAAMERIKQYEDRWKRYKQAKLTDTQVNKQYAVKNNAERAAREAYVAAREAGKPEDEARTAGKAAAKATASKFIEGSGNVDALFRGGGRAERMKRFGEYWKNLPAEQKTQQAVSAQMRQRVMNTDPRYQSFETSILPRFTYQSGAQSRATEGIKQAQRDFSKEYAAETAAAPQEYSAERNKRIGGFLKNNWGKIAGLGLGAMGLLALNRIGSKMQTPGTPGADGVQQAQKPAWSESSRLYAGDYSRAKKGSTLMNTMPGSQQFGSAFKQFMTG